MNTKNKKVKTIKYKSRTDGRRWYKTQRLADGKLQCNCPGWIYHRHCWHIAKVADMR
jgi:hypothetical protein